MKQINLKKRLLPNLPYVFIGLYATKLGQMFRLSPGADLSSKLLHIGDGFAAAFARARFDGIGRYPVGRRRRRRARGDQTRFDRQRLYGG